MFDSTFFKFLIAFAIIIGLSSIIINLDGGLGNNTAVSSSTQK